MRVSARLECRHVCLGLTGVACWRSHTRTHEAALEHPHSHTHTHPYPSSTQSDHNYWLSLIGLLRTLFAHPSINVRQYIERQTSLFPERMRSGAASLSHPPNHTHHHQQQRPRRQQKADARAKQSIIPMLRCRARRAHGKDSRAFRRRVHRHKDAKKNKSTNQLHFGRRDQ